MLHHALGWCFAFRTAVCLSRPLRGQAREEAGAVATAAMVEIDISHRGPRGQVELCYAKAYGASL